MPVAIAASVNIAKQAARVAFVPHPKKNDLIQSPQAPDNAGQLLKKEHGVSDRPGVEGIAGSMISAR